MESRDLAPYQDTYGLRDWDIKLRFDKRGKRQVGDVVFRHPYRQATITVYPRGIQATRKDFDETVESVIHHEFGEIVVWDIAEGRVPEKLHDKEWFVDFMDAVADYIGKMGERLWEAEIRDRSTTN